MPVLGLSCGLDVGSSSLTRDQTQPLALGVWSPSHWTTREVPVWITLVNPSPPPPFPLPEFKASVLGPQGVQPPPTVTWKDSDLG